MFWAVPGERSSASGQVLCSIGVGDTRCAPADPLLPPQLSCAIFFCAFFFFFLAATDNRFFPIAGVIEGCATLVILCPVRE